MSTFDKHSSVLIIGAGAFGTSTAFHLVEQGYQNVTILDRFSPPSKDAASSDLNKVIRYDYPNPLYTALAQETMEVWKSSNHLLSGMFHPTGWLMSANGISNSFVDAAYITAKKLGIDAVRRMDVSEIKRKWPGFKGDFPAWTNVWSPEAGWVPSADALLRMVVATERKGAQYYSGSHGHVRQLIYNESGVCLGAITEDGHTHLADVVVLCTGANTAALVDAKDEIIARSHCIGVIQLRPEEVHKYEDLPIIDNFEQGIFFPPTEDGQIKLCSCRFITNYVNSAVPGASLGHSLEDFPNDRVPRQIEQEMRQFISEICPELANRDWSYSRMCWDGDTKDVNFRICPYPKHENLFIATAGSGHGFKFMPIIGKYIVRLLEGKLSPEYSDIWRWKHGEMPKGAAPSPHPWPVRDLGELDGWKGSRQAQL